MITPLIKYSSQEESSYICAAHNGDEPCKYACGAAWTIT
jgi:hypothetical protein